MKLRTFITALALLTVLVIASTPLKAQSGDLGKVRLEGAWNAVLTAGPFQEKERYSFAPGRTITEGSLVMTNQVDTVGFCGASQGVWLKTGRNEFTATHSIFCADPGTGAPAVTLKFREALTVNDRSDAFTGRGIFEVFDPQGNLVFAQSYTLQGTRAQTEALPPAEESADTIPATNARDSIWWFKPTKPQ